MISFYSGTPGSGKSLRMAHEVELWLKKLKKNVISNVAINRNYILRGRNGGHLYHVQNEKLTVDFLYKYALRHHVIGKESQTLVVIDEAQVKFSPTAVKLFTQEDSRYRQDWLEFFSQHRHLGYDIILISQFDRLIDPQIRCLFEYNFIHRKANNFRTIGKILTIFRIKMFVQIQFWYGCNEKCDSNIFFFQKKYARIYDSFAFRNQLILFLTKKYGIEMMQKLMGARYVPPVSLDEVKNNLEKYKNKDKKTNDNKSNNLENKVVDL